MTVTYEAATQSPSARTPLCRTQLSETKTLPDPRGTYPSLTLRLELDLGRQGKPWKH